MTVSEFIEAKKLSFVEDNVTGDFWGGEDNYKDHKYELFIKGNKDGPLENHILKYESFLTVFDSIFTEIQGKTKEFLISKGTETWDKFKESPVIVLLIGVDQNAPTGEIEIATMVKAKGFIFRKSFEFVSGIRNNQVVAFAEMGS